MGKVEAYFATARKQKTRRRPFLLLICVILLSVGYVIIGYSAILQLHGEGMSISTTAGSWDRHRQPQRLALRQRAEDFGKTKGKRAGVAPAKTKGGKMNGVVPLKPGIGSLAAQHPQKLAGKLSVYSGPQLNSNFERSGMKNQRILLFVTAHANPGHVDFFRYCWPLALQQSQLLSSADILVYTSSDGNSTIDAEFRNVLPEVFPHSEGQNVSLIFYDNPGYQEGAIRAMTDGFNYRWFNYYDCECSFSVS